MNQPYINLLSIGSYSKEIPYLGTVDRRQDEQINYGFKNLIIRPELIDAIPELDSDRALKSLVSSMNFGSNRFFTIGCFSRETRSEDGYQYSGDIEFSWNCQVFVRDALHYLSLFFHFEQFLFARSFEQKIKFHWSIEETQFIDINLVGFCCAITIETDYCSSSEQAYRVWQTSLKLLESFLASVPMQPSLAIYEDRSFRLPVYRLE